MRLLLTGVLFGLLVLPAGAADKDEDKAKEAALAFAKAVNARDVDAIMKVADVPYYGSPKGKDTIFEKAEDLKAEFKRLLGGLKADNKLPETVVEVHEFEAHVKKEGAKDDDPEVKMARKVLGKNGYIVVLGKDKIPGGAVLVAIKDGKAKVVGMPE